MYTCKHCLQTTVNPINLVTHSGEPYASECKCTKSLLGFSKIRIYKEHELYGSESYNDKLNDSQIWECDLCNCTFSKSDELYIHARAHRGSSHIKCKCCHHTLKNYWRLILHFLRLHSGTYHKHLRCSPCKKYFKSHKRKEIHIESGHCKGIVKSNKRTNDQ